MQGRRRLQPSDTNSPNPFPKPSASPQGDGGRKNKTQGRRAAKGGRACIRIRPLPSSGIPLQRESPPSCTRAAPPGVSAQASLMHPPRPQPRPERSRRPHNAAPEGDGGHKELKAATAGGLHLFPFRTEKLNPRAPMILRKRESRSPPPPRAPESDSSPGRSFFAHAPQDL